MNWAAFWDSALNSTPCALARMPTGYPWISAHPVARLGPYSGLNSSNSEPSATRTITSRGSNGVRRSPGTIPSRSSSSNSGGRGEGRGAGPAFRRFRRATTRRAVRSASASSSAK
jgi:hypothetical protein